MASDRLFVLPGETIDPALVPTHKKHPLRLGPGLRHIPPSDIVPTVAGQLITNPLKNSMWVEFNSQRYIPTTGDLVLATVTRNAPEAYLCSLSAYTPAATLPHLAFEGATKKTRPQLAPGQLVYARVALAHRHMDPELECVSAATGRADGLGPIAAGNGCVFDVSLGFARRLLMARSREDGGVGVLEMLAGQDPEVVN
ncbi:f1a4630c-dc49-4d39-a614-c1d1998b0514 [Thermothielavioides terrestris]|uniref:F1a4630c-dc49-4d39-a614-c1d1998b0514 n=1 Tax=Thermothielavioides terrestris TaxID=2587410 RepID=A0A3S5CW30_9PEZI|nr:f1a4630c-dc49-4d39-a614-c1d1998b0514 [Thermothielavioides terrestris]